MHAAMVRANRYPGVRKLNKQPSEYFRSNIWITTSGMQWAPAIQFCISVLGIERVMYAMDYPYQFVPEEVKVTDEMPMSDADRIKLYKDNVEEVFRLR
jgi:2,3-dihydroxybenzoate decarboxylase